MDKKTEDRYNEEENRIKKVSRIHVQRYLEDQEKISKDPCEITENWTGFIGYKEGLENRERYGIYGLYSNSKPSGHPITYVEETEIEEYFPELS